MPRPSGEENSGAVSRMIRIETREDLVNVLSEASTLEHMIMCGYLFAEFSLKRNQSEGLTPKELQAVKKWEETIKTVAVQEMTHLALVNNMLVSIGSSPYFQHANFPQPSKYFSPNIRLALMPFGEQALRHFLYLERPEGMSVEGVPGFEVLGKRSAEAGESPQGQFYSTVGNLYHGIEDGFRSLAQKHGEDGLFIGVGHTQANEENLGLPDLIEVRDLSSVGRAVRGIVEMGEGARGAWQDAHFGKFLGIYKDLSERMTSNPEFHPSRPVVAAYARPPFGVENVPLITDSRTSRVSTLFNSIYGLAIQTLSRYYVHDAGKPKELAQLADVAVTLMVNALKPIGVILTSLPVGPHLPGLTAGPTFELQQREYILPFREQAFMTIQERLVELADRCSGLADALPSAPESSQLEAVGHSLIELARGIELT